MINYIIYIMEDYIKDKRPNVSDSTLKTYNSILTNLHKKVFGNDIDVNNFNKSGEILKFLNDMESRKRKTILSALVVITDNVDYRKLMLADIGKYNKEEAKQTKTAKQENNWVNNDDILDVYKDLEKTAKLLYKKKDLTMNDKQDIQDYIIIALLSGKYIPPRRSKDFVDFKIRNIDKDKDNYKDKTELIFNSYKTAKTYGKQTVKIPIVLNNILNKWIKHNDTDWLLYDNKKEQLSNVKLNQRLNKIFDKKAGVNMLRKSYLSNKYGDMINEKNNLKNDMSKMGSSLLQEKIYIKK